MALFNISDNSKSASGYVPEGTKRMFSVQMIGTLAYLLIL